MDGHKIHGWLPSGQSCAGERYEPESPEPQAAVLPTPARRSEILGLLTTLFLLNKLKSLHETAWYSCINIKTRSWNIPGYYSGVCWRNWGNPERISDKTWIIYNSRASASSFIIQRIHLLCYTQITKFQLKSTYVLLTSFVIHTPVSRRTDF